MRCRGPDDVAEEVEDLLVLLTTRMCLGGDSLVAINSSGVQIACLPESRI